MFIGFLFYVFFDLRDVVSPSSFLAFFFYNILSDVASCLEGNAVGRLNDKVKSLYTIGMRSKACNGSSHP